MNTSPSCTEPNQTLDVKGLNCPLPILKVKKTLEGMQSGEVLRVEVTDSGATTDIPAYTNLTGHKLLAQETEAEVYIFLIEKK